MFLSSGSDRKGYMLTSEGSSLTSDILMGLGFLIGIEDTWIVECEACKGKKLLCG